MFNLYEPLNGRCSRGWERWKGRCKTRTPLVNKFATLFTIPGWWHNIQKISKLWDLPSWKMLNNFIISIVNVVLKHWIVKLVKLTIQTGISFSCILCKKMPCFFWYELRTNSQSMWRFHFIFAKSKYFLVESEWGSLTFTYLRCKRKKIGWTKRSNFLLNI